MNLNIGNKGNRPHSMTEQFAKSLTRCDIQEFFGICKILNVPVDNGAKTKEEFDLRPFEDIWSEIIDTFNNLGRRQRRELALILKKAVASDGNDEKKMQ